MKGIILVAGYATRLYPLTLNTPKALLPIGNKAIIDYILDEMDTIPEMEEIYVTTNAKFYEHFKVWADEKNKNRQKSQIVVINDGTLTEDTRLGGVGDILYTVEKEKIDDDLMVIAGDNFFTYSLRGVYDFYKEKNNNCVCVKASDDPEFLKTVGICELDSDNKIISMEEKPEHPKTNLVVYATYIYTKNTLPLLSRYKEEDNIMDAPGHFAKWVSVNDSLYAYCFDGECYDVGTPASYAEVQKVYAK